MPHRRSTGLQRFIGGPLLRLAVTLACLGMGVAGARAQSPLRSVGLNDPAANWYGWLRHEEGTPPGQQPQTLIGGTGILSDGADAFVGLLQGQFLITNDGELAGSTAYHHRIAFGSNVFGIGTFLDVAQSPHEKTFQQTGIALDFAQLGLIPHTPLIFRGGVAVPIGQSVRRVGSGGAIGGGGGLILDGNMIGTGGGVFTSDEVALTRINIEAAVMPVNGMIELFAGWYHLNGDVGGDSHGARAGLGAYLLDSLKVDVAVSDDQLFGTNVFGGVTWYFGGDGGNQPDNLHRMLRRPVSRDAQVALNNVTRQGSAFTQLVDQTSGDPLFMYFVAEGGAGAGTQADPSNIATVLGDSDFGAGSVMVLLAGGGDLTTPIVLNDPRQQVIGGGNTGAAMIDLSASTGNAGDIFNLTGLGARPTLAAGGGVGVTLTDGASVQGFSIDGASSGVFAGAGVSSAFMNDLAIANSSVAGLSFDGSPAAFELDASNIDITGGAGAGININAAVAGAEFNFANVDVNGVGGAGIDIFGGSGGTYSFDAATSITNATGAAFNVVGDGTNSPQIVYSGTIANSAGRAISIQNTAGPNSITFNSAAVNAITDTGTGVFLSGVNQNVSFAADVELSGTEGLSIVGGTGLYTFNDTDITDIEGGAAIDIDGGSSTVLFQVNSSVTQGENQAALFIHGGHTGNFTQSALGQISATNGTGLQFDNADGAYNLNGIITLNGGDAGLDVLNGSGGNLTIANLFITNPTGTAINIDTGSGNINVLGGTITKSNAGQIVSITDRAGGLIDFNSDITASGAASGIEISGATVNTTVRFDGDVGLGLSAADRLTAGTSAVEIDHNATGSSTTFANLNIFADGIVGLNASNGGTVGTTTGAIDVVNAVAVDLDGVASAITLTDLTSDGSGGAGIELSGLTTGSVFNVTGDTTISNTTGAGIDVSGSHGELDFANLTLDTIGGNGVNLANSPFLQTTIGLFDIDNVSGHGLAFNNAGVVLLGTDGTASSIDGTSDDGIHSVDTHVSITDVDIGTNALVQGDGIEFSATGNLDLDLLVDGVNIGDAAGPLAVGGRGIVIDAGGTDTIQATITDTTVYSTDQALLTSDSGGANTLNLALNNLTLERTTAGFTAEVNGGATGSTFVTSMTGTNTIVGNGTSGGWQFDTVTFDADPILAGVQQVVGGDLFIGDAANRAQGDGLRLNDVLGDVAFGDVEIFNDGGTGLFIRDDAGKGGTFGFSNTGGVIDTTNGAAMDIDPVVMDSTFASVSSTNSAGFGVNLDTITGTVDILGGSITGAAGTAFNVVDSDAEITYGGTINNTAGLMIAVTNTTGGFVTFNNAAAGALTDTGSGILIDGAAGDVTVDNAELDGATGVVIQGGGTGVFTFNNVFENGVPYP